MTKIKYLQKLFFLLVVGFSLCTVQACSGDDDDTMEDMTPEDAANDYGTIKGNNFVATGGYRNVKPLKATILASINTVYQGAYNSLGVEFTPNYPDFNSSATRRVSSNSGVTNGHFETHLAENGEGLLEPGTTYYYRAYVNMGGTRYNGETRSFVTPDLKLSEGKLVDLGLSVKWASCNMGANAPETAGTLLQQCYAYRNFNKAEDIPLFFEEDKTLNFVRDVSDDNWLGNSNYDVATRTMGSGYRIPTEEEWRELEAGCHWKAGTHQGVKGFYICDKADGTRVIFLPYVESGNAYDLTVYLSAPDDLIWTLKEQVVDLEDQYLIENNAHMTFEEACWIYATYKCDRLYIEEKLGVGEVLTKDTHVYCDHGLVLRKLSSLISASDWDGFDEIQTYVNQVIANCTWTHPKTGKKYNYYQMNKVNGAGILYVRAVGNK